MSDAVTVSLPWARWLAAPFALFSIVVVVTFATYRDDVMVLLWFAVAGGLGYLALAMMCNQTRITIGGGVIAVRHGPVPWRGVRLSAREVKTVSVSARSSADMTTATSWEIVAVMRDDRTVPLTWGPVVSHRFDLLDTAARTLMAHLDRLNEQSKVT